MAPVDSLTLVPGLSVFERATLEVFLLGLIYQSTFESESEFLEAVGTLSLESLSAHANARVSGSSAKSSSTFSAPLASPSTICSIARKEQGKLC